MSRWFEETGKDGDVVISSRVRLARNIADYNFSLKLDDKDAKKLIKETSDKIDNIKELEKYAYYNFDSLDDYQKMAMKERHVISEYLLGQELAAGYVSSQENVSIMLNEEDHIRIQTYSTGMDLDKCYKMADTIDDYLGAELNYAYDVKYGYLTTCLSSVGTGMKTSYMLHLPALTDYSRIAGLASEVGRFGLVLRSVYSDGIKSYGDIYQISNQVTLGVSEGEIIDNITHITKQIVDQERSMRKQFINEKKVNALDNVYRSYGVLKYARKLTLTDAMVLLSQIRLGIATGLIKPEASDNYNVYQLMIGIQPGNLELMGDEELDDEELDVRRASFIRENLVNIL